MKKSLNGGPRDGQDLPDPGKDHSSLVLATLGM